MQYRLLNKNEVIQKGDQYYDHENKPGERWVDDNSNIGRRWEEEVFVPFRRPIVELKTKICPFCKGGCVNDSKFCQHCGKEFPTQAYRLLEQGEVVEEGDEYFSSITYMWTPTALDNNKPVTFNTPIRRKIKSFEE